MSIPPLPPGTPQDPRHDVANGLHSIAIHLLRHARTADDESGLTSERLSLLSVLAYDGPKTISELASIEMVSLPAITRIVNYLEEPGLVDRERGDRDGRVVRVVATEAGINIMEAGRRKRVESIAAVLKGARRLQLMVLQESVDMLDDALDALAAVRD